MGKKSILSSDEFDPAPSDLSNMDMSQIQELMRKQHWAGFWVRKLQFGVRGTPVNGFLFFAILVQSLTGIWFCFGIE